MKREQNVLDSLNMAKNHVTEAFERYIADDQTFESDEFALAILEAIDELSEALRYHISN